ncbi:putative arsenite methyltransferase [Diplonema papillatum]|nr:putative arsenite methyltransferase [Diplonema papillatum]
MSCCPKNEAPATSCCPTKEAPAKSGETIMKEVEEYYGKVLSTSKDLKTSACTASARPHRLIMDIIKKLPNAVTEKFYGCGAPLPLGIDGLSVLDLGSGSGRDCYVAATLVGEQGKVTGIDMTQEQLVVAREHAEAYTKSLGYAKCNMEYLHGYIEKFPESIKDGSYDMVISNCVVNLSPDKPAVLREAYRALKEGGEFYFSDVYCDRRLPQHVKDHEVLWGECISGALYIEDFIRESNKAGFTDPRELSRDEIKVLDPELSAITGNAKFYSITYRLFKLPGMLETKCEDYGQFAVYKGTIPGNQHNYMLDDHHVLITGKPFLVCGNTAAMLGENGKSWLAKHFTITGDRSVHYGLFDCSSPPAVTASASSAASCAPKGGSCC